MFLKLDEKRKRSKGNSFSFTIKGKATDGSNVSKLQKNSLSMDGLTTSACILYFGGLEDETCVDEHFEHTSLSLI
jgi:hypothetical protein